ncbi:MAG: xanthine dehydrogenase family protein molybdopterin-binding subunit, partial [Rhodospirillaceae bacterium]|nr:xanthine dehydrogenase family protein molybdopterin-binding subunit [Rhodospirillaceae bacterium]
MTETGIGVAVRRVEDYRFLTGQGNYTDDINRPGQAHAWILRSPHAHANIKSIDAKAALAAPGVIAVFTGKDVVDDGLGGLPCGWQVTDRHGEPMIEPAHPILVPDTVRHVGDQVAVVIAETRDQARDASEKIAVDYEPLAACASTAEAMSAKAPQVWGDAKSNLCYDWELGDRAACDD